MPLLLSWLAEQGLGLLKGAVEAKGKDVVEKLIGVKLPTDASQLTPELATQLQVKQMEHEEKLQEFAVRKAEIEMEAESRASQQVTDRWKADMTSDSWLSKNIRPLTLAYLTVFVTFSSWISQWLNMSEAWVDLLKEGWLVVLSAYFVGRTIQHVSKTRSKK